VVGLISGGAGVPQVATATAHAVRDGFALAALDPALREAVWLLARLPRAAKAEDFPAALFHLGLRVDAPPSLFELTAAVSERVDACRPRTDVAELAHDAACSTLMQVVGAQAGSLFGTTPVEVQRAVAGFDTAARFATLARAFFARFAARMMDFYLGREIGEHLGDGKRFPTLASHADFRQALADHCHLSTAAVETLAAEWYSKARYESGGEIPRGSAHWLAEHALDKLAKVLRREAA
jgi:hypothetical protein